MLRKLGNMLLLAVLTITCAVALDDQEVKASTSGADGEATGLCLLDFVKAFFHMWFSYNQIFFFHLLMDNYVDKVMHTVLGMAHDVIPSNNVPRGAYWSWYLHVQTCLYFCGGPVPIAIFGAAYMDFITIPPWYYLGLAMTIWLSFTCHFTHRSVHILNFNPDNFSPTCGLTIWERAWFYPVHLACQAGILDTYNSHHGHHYNAEGNTDTLVAMSAKVDRGGFAMFATRSKILGWTLSLDYVDRDAYVLQSIGNYATSFWSFSCFFLRFWGVGYDRMLTVCFIQWAFLVFVKYNRPDFEDIKIPERTRYNYETLHAEKKRLYALDKTLAYDSETKGMNPRKYDDRLKFNLDVVKEGEKQEWLRSTTIAVPKNRNAYLEKAHAQ